MAYVMALSGMDVEITRWNEREIEYRASEHVEDMFREGRWLSIRRGQQNTLS
jgi:hypothetical protein